MQGPNVEEAVNLALRLEVGRDPLSIPFQCNDLVPQVVSGTWLLSYLLPHGVLPVSCRSAWSIPGYRSASYLYPLPQCLDRDCPPVLRSMLCKSLLTLHSLSPSLQCIATGFSAVVIQSIVSWSSGVKSRLLSVFLPMPHCVPLSECHGRHCIGL